MILFKSVKNVSSNHYKRIMAQEAIWICGFTNTKELHTGIGNMGTIPEILILRT